jgi:hypothetical protein
MKLVDNSTQITMLRSRMNLLRTRGEQERQGIINKLARQIRKLEQEENA